MHTRSLEDLEAHAADSDDLDELRAIVDHLIARLELLNVELIEVEAKPERNQRLAKAVRDFAEWHKHGYDGEERTRSAISSALWHEVLDCTQNIVGAFPAGPSPFSR